MDLEAIKSMLGVTGFVWIDDMFGIADRPLEELIAEHPGVVEQFPELEAALAALEYSPEDLTGIVAALEAVPSERRRLMRTTLIQMDAVGDAATELPPNMIAEACDTLGIPKADRLSFEDGVARIKALPEGGGADIAFVVDLKEAGGSPDRGLDMLSQLRERKFAGIAFILTHEATPATEMEEERRLGQELGAPTIDDVPVTVIAKPRLQTEGEGVEATFSLALRRAGLRHTLRPLLLKGRIVANAAYSAVAAELLALEPERLQKYVYQLGSREGESELHVLERGISAELSSALRTCFATSAEAFEAARCVRRLSSAPLDGEIEDAGDVLSRLQQLEVADPDEVVNRALRPLSNGDVFQVDAAEPGVTASEKLFVLLGQPCDLLLRGDGRRVSEMGMLMPIAPVGGIAPPPAADGMDERDDDKGFELPFRLLGGRKRVKLHELAYARLSILDLATFRPDGRVAVDLGHVPSDYLLAGASAVYADRTIAADELLAQPIPQGAPSPSADERLLLTLSRAGTWNVVRAAYHRDQHPPQSGQQLPRRVTWRLRRIATIRAPYSGYLLERVSRLMGRRAFDADYAA